MNYDPIKSSLGKVFNSHPVLRKLFYRLLDLLLLRTWHVHKELRKWASTHSGEAHLLDAGMGFGQYSFWMARYNPNWNILGVDVKEEQIADCNDFFPRAGISNARFEFADLVKFDKYNAYDLILSVDVMEHILEDEDVFKNFHASLKNEGVLMISTPSDQGGSDVHDHHEHDSSGSFIGEHVRDGYGIEEIERKLKNAGFSKIESRYTYGWPGKISWKLSMKYPILMVNTSKLFFLILPFWYIITFPFALILNAIDAGITLKTGTGLMVKAWK
ncbi:MAG: class I SAM-dependent methyltransferase [Bacteroidales bacterium]|nr:class I SAM-dependent methyltransferase [Bacteroidales bacterium]